MPNDDETTILDFGGESVIGAGADYVGPQEPFQGEEGGTSAVRPQASPNAESQEGETPRGRPILQNAVERRAVLMEQGRIRVNSLTSMFGKDALVLGHLVFNTPPLSISIKKQNINYRWKSLRTREATVIPSGNGEAFIDIALAFVGTREIRESLNELIILWKVAPFCFIENLYIREMMIPNDLDDSMAVRLETLHMTARTGFPDVVWANLSLGWFNYKPYSHHFWFRERWHGNGVQEINGRLDIPNLQGEVLGVDRNSIIDVSQVENPEELDVSLPPEQRLPNIEQQGDPGDIRLAPTSPVIYPFNSDAFLRQIQHFRDNEAIGKYTFEGPWHDQISMKWNTYTRIPWPRQALNIEVGEEIERPPPRTVPANRVIRPTAPPVEGDRDIVLFAGDSITIRYLNISDGGLGARNITNSISSSFRAEANHSDSIAFWACARVGANSAQINAAVTQTLNNEAISSKLAALVISSGTNDQGNQSRTVDNVKAMADRAKALGALVYILPIWPLNDPVRGDTDYGKQVGTLSDAYQAAISPTNGALQEVARDGGEKVLFLNTHTSLISTDPNSFNGCWTTGLRIINGNQINIHPRFRPTDSNPVAATTTIAQTIHDGMDWSAIRGIRQ